jgi:hypothetical protein
VAALLGVTLMTTSFLLWRRAHYRRDLGAR